MALSSVRIRTGGFILFPGTLLPEDVCDNIQQIIIDQLLCVNTLHLCTQGDEQQLGLFHLRPRILPDIND